MNESLPDWKPGSPPSASRLNAMLPSLRSVRYVQGGGDTSVTQTDTGTSISTPTPPDVISHFLGLVTNSGPNGEPDFTSKAPGAYWVKVCQILGPGNPFYLSQVKYSTSAPAPPNIFSVTNVAEVTQSTTKLANSGSRTLPTDSSRMVHVWAFLDATQVVRYVMDECPPQAWIYIDTIMPPASSGSPNGGGGFYNAKLLTGSPVTISPLGDVVIPTFPNEALPATDNVLGQNSLEANLGNPPSHWVPLGCYVPAWYVGMSNESPPRPVYRFAYPVPGPVSVKIISTNAYYTGGIGAGRYAGSIGTGRVAGISKTSNFRPPDTGLTYSGTANCVLTDIYEGGSAAAGTAVIANGSIVHAFFVGYDSENPTVPVLYFSSAPTGTLFIVNLTQDGGSDGTNTAPNTYTYTGTSLGGATLFKTAIQARGIPNGSMVPAPLGTAYIDLTGAIILAEAWETPNTTSCM